LLIDKGRKRRGKFFVLEEIKKKRLGKWIVRRGKGGRRGGGGRMGQREKEGREREEGE